MLEITIREVQHRGSTWYSPVVKGEKCSCISETYDVALLLGLQIKYEGMNSQFTKNACRMLRIDSAWAE